ncbi:class II fructose-bisphosphate aldolase [uncultured Jatrophihabitans sp.]|uniref:class II fructose-bisphosphate aldolase n=1 Tax=uncultured Jatrophihabitans sp. TaxID=1610747 RepID=UPI0035CC237A
MTVTTTRELLADAVGHRKAVLAVNVITLEHAEAIAAAAERCDAAVIMQLSENAIRYHRGRLLPIATAMFETADAARVPVALHLDHVTDPELVTAALEPATVRLFSSMMYDAGALPHAQNLSCTRDVAARAHEHGYLVEAELGYVGGKPHAPASAHAAGVRTDPDEAVEFVTRTGVDALAVAVGSSHAMTERTARLDVDLINALRARVPVPLVLHGSSGVAADDLRSAVSAGIAKINVGTAVNVRMTAAIRATLGADGQAVDPRGYLTDARDAMTHSVTDLLAAVR